MRSEAQKRADKRLAEKQVAFSIKVNRETHPDVADKLNDQKGNPQFKAAFYEWIISRW